MDKTTLAALAAFPAQLEAHYALIPAGFEHWAPASWDGVPSEPFTAIEQVCHVRDIEVEGYHVRVRRIRDENRPLLASIDSEAVARDRDYASADVAAVFADIRAARSETLAMISALSPADFGRSGEFEGYGALTLRGLVHYLCSHDQQHLSGLQWLLGKIDAARASGG